MLVFRTTWDHSTQERRTTRSHSCLPGCPFARLPVCLFAVSSFPVHGCLATDFISAVPGSGHIDNLSLISRPLSRTRGESDYTIRYIVLYSYSCSSNLLVLYDMGLIPGSIALLRHSIWNIICFL